MTLPCRFQILDPPVPMVQAAGDRMCNNVFEPLDRACVGFMVYPGARCQAETPLIAFVVQQLRGTIRRELLVVLPLN